jgi:integrase
VGHVERRGKNRWKARYRGPNGKEYSKTHPTKGDAERWLASETTKMARGVWVDPAVGRQPFESWWADWIDTLDVRASTADLYAYLGRRYLLPTFGRRAIATITTGDVRHWLASMRLKRLSPNTVAKAYRLLGRVMSAAVDEGVIGRSPCTIKGASVERSPEMRCPSLGDVHELADAVPEQYRALVYTAALAGLRWGELAGLRRQRVDLLHKTITVAEQLTEVNGHLDFGTPKTDASIRTVVLPELVVDSLDVHLARCWAEPGPDGLVFPASGGGPMRRSNFRRRVWTPALARVGLVGVPFHALRHVAGTQAAVAGATTKELMARMGHASPRAALIYQHATAQRDAHLAAQLDLLAASARPGGSREDRGNVAHLR